MMNTEPARPGTPGIGHNSPPEPLPTAEEISKRLSEWLKAATEWSELEAIENDHQAGLAADFITGLRNLRNEAEEARKAEKQPHLDAGRAIDAKFKAINDRAYRALQVALKKQGDYLAAKERRQREEAEAARRLAEEEAAEAQAKAEAASVGHDFEAQAETQAAAEEAAERVQQAERKAKQRTNAKSASGTGRTTSLVTVYTAAIDKSDPAAVGKACKHFRNHPDLLALLERLATAETRQSKGGDVPGFTIHEEKKAR